MSRNSPLQEISRYSEITEYYEANKNRPWKEWLTFERTFDKPGKQGLVGLFKLKKGGKDQRYVFKISQYINYLVHHENTVISALTDISPYCPHFCKSIGVILCDVDPKHRKSGNTFDIKSKYPIEKEVLLTEFIDKSCKFYNYIRSSKIEEDILYSTIKQVLMGLSIAQKKKRFTHYDLHSFNIMMKRCNPDLVFLYVLDDSNQFCVPTYGHYPVIIDFGFSYIDDMKDNPLWTSLAHTNAGFMSDRFDWVADPKLFLVTVSDEIKIKRNTKKAKRFRRIVKNLFFSLNVDWESGWDEGGEKGAIDYITETIEEENDISDLFAEYDHYCFDILQSLIILPLEEQNHANIEKAYKVWLSEWVKIENEISSHFYNLYILKGVVDAARQVRPDYKCNSTREEAVNTFKRVIYERINKVSKFCSPKNVHFEKMLCSLLVLSRSMEGMLYDIISERMEIKKKEYERLPLKSTEQIFAAIETNIQDEYVYNENTTVIIYDSVKEETNFLKLEKEYIKIINKMHPLCRGTAIYDIYKGNAPEF